MPRAQQMSWVETSARWMKVYRGKRYVVSCRQLGCPPNKADSLVQANLWWLAKQAEIDAQPSNPDWRLWHKAIARAESKQVWLIANGIDATQQAGVVEMLKREYEAGEPYCPYHHSDEFHEDVEIWNERLRANPQIKLDETLGYYVSQWLDKQTARARTGQLAADRLVNIRLAINRFKDHLSASTPVREINGQKLESFHTYCLRAIADNKWSARYCSEMVSIAEMFCRWLWEQDLIELPKNLGKLKFKITQKQIPIVEPKVITQIITKAPRQLKLHLLLMLNCGMTQKDVSDLLQSEVDWEKGIITRKRSKTSDIANVPVVRYRLWKETFALLREHRSNHPELALLTLKGNPWVLATVREDSSVWTVDNIATNFRNYSAKNSFTNSLGGKVSLKQLRKTGASMLDNHPTYGRYTAYFLGHAPRSIADRHYVQPSQDQFDLAIRWLGDQFGIA